MQQKQSKIIVLKNEKQEKHKQPDLNSESQKEKIKQALIKKAIGFSHKEVVEEYVISEEGDAKLLKRKVTKKFSPPDIPAVKILLEEFEEKFDFENMTEEELEKEKQKLLKQLKDS